MNIKKVFEVILTFSFCTLATAEGLLGWMLSLVADGQPFCNPKAALDEILTMAIQKLHLVKPQLLVQIICLKPVDSTHHNGPRLTGYMKDHEQ